MGKVYMIFTGGTISMRIRDIDHSVVPALSADEIMQKLLAASIYENLETIEFSKVPSPSLTPLMMMEIATTIQPLINRDDVDGIVVVHGTDTLEETAFFLDIVCQTQKPIVITGSMKSSSELGFDGLNNLVSSILVARSKKAINQGVLVVMNDQINAACEVQKTNTLTLDTFKSLDYGPLGIVDNGQVIFYRHMNYSRIKIPTSELVDNVHLIKAFSGADSLLLDHLVDHIHTAGIVIEALGRGNLPPTMLSGIKHALEENIPVIICSRCPSGRVLDTYGYEGGGKNLTSIGCILAPYLNGQKARMLLMIALSISNDHDYLKQVFDIQEPV